MALSRLLKFWIYRVNQASNTFCSPGWLLCTVTHCEKAIMVDYSGDEIWGKCRQGLIVYLFSPQISPTKGKKQLPFLVKLLFFSVYSTAVQYFPCLRKHSKTCWKKKLKKHRQVLFSKPGLFILGKFCPSRWEGKSKTFLYLSISSNAFEYTFCETS